MIKVTDYTNNAFSMEDANRLIPLIDKDLACGRDIILDFTGVKYFTTLFFNNAVAKYVIALGPQVFKEKFKLLHLSEVGRTTYGHSLDNALSYYQLPDEKRPEARQIIEETLQEALS